MSLIQLANGSWIHDPTPTGAGGQGLNANFTLYDPLLAAIPILAAASANNLVKTGRAPDSATRALYPFDGDGTDLAGHHDATLLNTPTFTAALGSLPGRAITFDGISQHVKVAGLADDPSGSISVMGWVKPGADYSAATARLVNKWWKSAAGGAPYSLIDLYIDHGPVKLTLYPNSSLVSLTGKTTSLPSGTPFHLALTIGSRGPAIWINGKLDAWDPNPGLPVTSGTVQPFCLGLYFDGATAQDFFHGSFDDVIVKSGQVLAEEIHAAAAGAIYVPGSEESGRLASVAANVLLSGSGGTNYDADAVLEQTNTVLLSDNVTRVAAFTGFRNATAANAIGLCTITFDGTREHWTRRSALPILGLGHGGEAGNTNAPWLFRAPNSTRIFLYYMAGYDSNAGIKVVYTDDDFATLSSPAVALAPPGWTDNAIANPGVSIDPLTGMWLMVYSALAGGLYVSSIAYCPKKDGLTWVTDGRGAMTSASLGGLYAMRTLAYAGGQWHAWGHASISGLNLPTFINRWTSPDRFTWSDAGAVQFTEGEILAGNPVNQVGDATIEEYSGFCHPRWDVDQDFSGTSGTFYSEIKGRSWKGTMSQLVSNSPLTALVR